MPPVLPWGPVLPVEPVGPVGPVDPVLPVGPVGPVAPVPPVGPDGPVAPVKPVAPKGPLGPGAPVFPTGPSKPEKITSTIYCGNHMITCVEDPCITRCEPATVVREVGGQVSVRNFLREQ